MPIPDRPKPGFRPLEQMMILLYGPPGIGKSTLVAQMPRTLVLPTEPGWGCLPGLLWQTPEGKALIEDERDANGQIARYGWDTLLTGVREGVVCDRVDRLAVDTLEQAVHLCSSYVCSKHGVEYHTDGDLGWGKGTALIVGEIRRVLFRLGGLQKGVVFTAHSSVETIERGDGKKYNRHAINLAERVRNAVMGMMDLVLFCSPAVDASSGETIRVMHTKPHKLWDAKDRTGKLPATIPMEPEGSAYANLVAAFEEHVAGPARAKQETASGPQG